MALGANIPRPKKVTKTRVKRQPTEQIIHDRVVKSKMTLGELNHYKPGGLLCLNRRCTPVKFEFHCEYSDNEKIRLIPFAHYKRSIKGWRLPLSAATVKVLFAYWPNMKMTTDAFLVMRKLIRTSKVEIEMLQNIHKLKAGTIKSDHILGTSELKLWDHQQVSVALVEEAWRYKYGFAYFSEQGTGKTLSAYTLLDRALKRNPNLIAIVYSPKSSLHVTWVKECRISSSLCRPFVPMGPGPKRAKRIIESRHYDWCETEDVSGIPLTRFFKKPGRPNLFLVNHEVGRRFKKGTKDEFNEVVQALIKIAKEADEVIVIVDECHRFSNPDANQTMAAMAVIKESDHLLAMTGTPGKPHKFLGLFNLIEPRVFPCNKGDFESRYVKYLDLGHFSKIVEYPNIEELRKRSGHYSVRYRQEDVSEIPEWSYTESQMELSKEQKEAYDAVSADVMVYVKGKNVSKTSIGGKLHALRNITSGFINDENKNPIFFSKNAKMDKLIERIEEELESTDANPDQIRKVMIACQYHHEITAIRMMFDKLQKKKNGVWSEIEYVVVTGKVVDTEKEMKRTNIATAWVESPKVRIFLGIEAAFMESLNLVPKLPQVCDIMFMWSSGFRPENRDQLIKRIIRHGQTRSVRIEEMTAIGTYDESVVDALHAGLDICSVVVGDIDSIEQIVKGRRRE